jgi:hypothetical protein
LVDEQGLLGLVEEENGTVLLVAEAEGFVRVVWPNAQPEISESAMVTTEIVRMFIRSPSWDRAHLKFAAYQPAKPAVKLDFGAIWRLMPSRLQKALLP